DQVEVGADVLCPSFGDEPIDKPARPEEAAHHQHVANLGEEGRSCDGIVAKRFRQWEMDDVVVPVDGIVAHHAASQWVPWESLALVSASAIMVSRASGSCHRACASS